MDTFTKAYGIIGTIMGAVAGGIAGFMTGGTFGLIFGIGAGGFLSYLLNKKISRVKFEQ